MKQRSPNHWTWWLFRWCNTFHAPRRQRWFWKLRLNYLMAQLDSYGFGVTIWHQGNELIWLWPWKRKRFNCDGSSAVWYCVDLGVGFKSLHAIEQWWMEYEAACRASALREEKALMEEKDVWF